MPITLNTKTYDNVGFNQNGQFAYSEKSAGIPSGFSYLTSKVGTGTGKSDSTVKWNLSLPIVATSDSDCSCAGDVLRTSYIRLEITLPAGSQLAERQDLRLRLKDLVASAQFIAAIDNLVQPSA